MLPAACLIHMAMRGVKDACHDCSAGSERYKKNASGPAHAPGRMRCVYQERKLLPRILVIFYKIFKFFTRLHDRILLENRESLCYHIAYTDCGPD